MIPIDLAAWTCVGWMFVLALVGACAWIERKWRP